MIPDPHYSDVGVTSCGTGSIHRSFLSTGTEEVNFSRQRFSGACSRSVKRTSAETTSAMGVIYKSFSENRSGPNSGPKLSLEGV